MSSQFTHDEIEYLQEFSRRESALGGLESFRGYISQSGHADFQFPHARHHRIMAEALEKLERGDIQRLMLMLPPGSAKSTVGSVQFASWYAARHPQDQILAVSSTQSLAENFARRRRNVCQTQEWKNISGVSIDPNQQSVSNFAYGNSGEQMAAGVGSSVIGRRAQIIILDDPVSSYEEVASDKRREDMWQWYQAELRSRLTPNGKELLIGTRWHAQDILGKILDSEEAGSWTVIRMPMLCDSPDDPMGRAFGEPLWPEWFTPQQIEENQRSPLRWSSMFQQVPLSGDGDWLHPEDLEIVDKVPENLGIWGSMDLAMTSGRGDFSVQITAGIDEDRNLYILDVWRERVTPDLIVKQLIANYKKYKPREVLIDDDAAAKTFRSLAHEMLRKAGVPVPLQPLPTRGKDKETRAASFRGFAKQGSVKLLKGAWNTDLLREIDTFPNGDHDDQVDCLSLLGRRMAAMAATHTEKTKKARPVMTKIGLSGGQTVINESLGEMFNDRSSRNRFNKGRI